MPKIGSEDSIAMIVGQDVGLMVRGFSAALQDSQILVQRAALDIVAATLPLDGVGFQKDTRLEEKLILLRVMTGVVLRRDLSLSRRLYSWLLGRAEDSEAQVQYFKQHGLQLLRQALIVELLETIRDSEDLAAKQRPYKVVLSLLDKWEISYPLTEVVVSDVLRALDRASRDGELNEEVSVESTYCLAQGHRLNISAAAAYHSFNAVRRPRSIPDMAASLPCRSSSAVGTGKCFG